MTSVAMVPELHIDGHSVRRDGEMWCLTDLWRAAGAPKEKRPNDWATKAGAGHLAFLRASVDTANGGIKILRTDRGRGKDGSPGATWGSYQVTTGYAMYLSPAFHARAIEVLSAFMRGQLVPAPMPSAERLEIMHLTLRYKAMEQGIASVWGLELKLELARLRKIAWDGTGPEPHQMAHPYGRTWRIILGDTVYEELKRRNPYPHSGSLHAAWLQEQRYKNARTEDMPITLVLARRSSRWSEFEAEMRSHFRRAPIQLRLPSRSNASPRLSS